MTNTGTRHQRSTLASALLAALTLAIITTRCSQKPSSLEATNPISLIKVPTSTAKLPPPAEKDAARAELQVRRLHDQQLKRNSPNELRQLASELIEKSAEIKEAAPLLAQLRLARELAARTADVELALSACDRLAERIDYAPFPIHSLKASAMAIAAGASSSQKQHARIADQSTLLSLRCIAMDDFINANAFARSAATSARITSDGFFERQTALLQGDLAIAEEWFARIQRLAFKLPQNAADERSNFECGQYLCLAKNAWPIGLPMIARGIDAQWKGLAVMEMKSPREPAERVSLGNRWWEIAMASKAPIKAKAMIRARTWYLKALEAQTNSAHMDELFLVARERLKAVPTERAAVRIQITIEGSATLEISSGELTLRNSHGVRGVRINSYSWGDFPRGGPETLMNFGETRFLPDNVDFSKAELTRRRISNQWGKIDVFTPAQDKVTLRAGHGPMGSADFDLMLSF